MDEMTLKQSLINRTKE
ncbi:hypothetical protein [Mycoplasmopsis cynos]